MSAMALTPPSLTRSPASPSNTYCPSERSSLDYPSPGMVEQQYKLTSMYGNEAACSLPGGMETVTTLPPLDTMSQAEWNPTAVMQPSSSASAMPSILSAEYDHFYDSSMAVSYGHDIYPAHPTQAHVVSHSPPRSTGGAPSRSPAPSSSHHSMPYQAPMSNPVASGMKMEAPGSEYGQPGEVNQYPSPRSVQGPYSSEATTYHAGPSGNYLTPESQPPTQQHQQSTWSKQDYHHPIEPEQFYSAPTGQLPSLMRGRRAVPPAPRPRRRVTTPENANFRCEVKGCGKLFSRSYNYNAHKETHNDKREYPFPCTVQDCDKKFVRKTDLQRHHQSVHMKQRDHRCDYCGRLFARKDTLRRHMEDGCSKRFDIGTLDIRAEGYEINPSGRSMGNSTNQLVTSSGGLPPLAIPPLASSGLLASVPPLLRSRDVLAGGDQEMHGHHSWGR